MSKPWPSNVVNAVPPSSITTASSTPSGRPSSRKPPAGRHQHAAADPVDRDPVAGRQHLDAAHARHDRAVEVDDTSLAEPLDEPQRGVEPRGITPDEDAGGLLAADLLRQCPLDALDPLVVPRVHGLFVGPVAVADRIGDLDHAVPAVRHPAGQHGATHLGQLGLGLPLVEEEEDVHRSERVGGLRRDERGIAGADPDHEQPHAPTLPDSWAGVRAGVLGGWVGRGADQGSAGSPRARRPTWWRVVSGVHGWYLAARRSRQHCSSGRLRK